MELLKIETLIEKYFEGETNTAEEKQLQQYFESAEVPQHLEQYKPIFGYFAIARDEKAQAVVKLPVRKNTKAWLSVAASVVILAGVGTFAYMGQDTPASDDLGTYDNPEVAFRETQRALNLLSTHVNTGVESVHYIQEYEAAKGKIFERY